MHRKSKNIDEIKTFIKKSIEDGKFCDVTLAFKDGFRKCNSIIFLLTGQFWKDVMISCIILPDMDARSFDTMIVLDGFVTIKNKENNGENKRGNEPFDY